MKKFLFCVLVLLAASVALAQYTRFDASNCYRIDPLTVYAPNEDGFLVLSYNPVYEVDSVERIYAYDKKHKTAYMQTNRGNYAVVLKDDVAKMVQKDKSISKLNNKDLQAAIEICDKTLEWKADKYNTAHSEHLEVLKAQARKKQIEDSIREARRQDSLARVRQAEELAEQQRQMEQYRSTHEWQRIPRDGARISCLESGCDNYFTGDTIWALGIQGDTIVYTTPEELFLGVVYIKAHYAKLKYNATENPNLAYHIKAFADSLFNNVMDSPIVDLVNMNQFQTAVEKLKKKAPYGFVKDWGWDDEYGTLSFHLDYVNLNQKTIKYIDIYWALKNDVNDRRGTGHFKGTGPVPYGEGGSWSWDNTLYFVAGDATTMDITKIVLTYMNGTTKTLTAKEIKYDEEEE